MSEKTHKIKRGFWEALFLFHRGYKEYYIGIVVVLVILLSPLKVLLNPNFWVMSAEEYRLFGILSSILMGIFFAFALIIYLTIWRVLFPTYWIVGKVDPYKMGRLYWSSRNVFAINGRGIRRKYGLGNTEEKELTILVNQGRLLNIFNPWKSLTVLHLPIDAKMWREPTKVNVFEPSARRKVLGPNGETEYLCNNVDITTNIVDSDAINQAVNDGVQHCVQIAQTASHADVELAKELLADGSVWLPSDIKQKADEWEEEDNARG